MSFYTSVHRYGNSILYRGYNDHGAQVQERVKFKPTLYVPVTDENDDGEFIALDGRKLNEIKFDSLKDAKEFMDQYENVENFKIYGNTNYVAQFINDRFPGEIKFNPSFVNVGYIDIEVNSNDGFPHPDEAKYEFLSIAYKSSKSHVYRVWGMGSYDPTKSEVLGKGDLVQYTKCDNEIDMLLKFIEFWTNHYPDIITGWNIRLFDIPYIINRIKKVLGEEYSNKLSPWKVINYREISVKNKTLDTYEIYGVHQMDYMDLFQKFGYTYGTQESYSLNHISHVVLGEKKLSYEEHGSLQGLFEKDYQKFIDYNIKDVMLVFKMEEFLRLMELAMIVSYKGGVNYPDTFGTTAIWDSIIYRALDQKGIVIPPSEHKVSDTYVGGYVKEPVPGLYNWVTSFDLNSLYPNIIVQYNMSPETIVKNPFFYGKNDVQHYLNNDNPIPDHILDKNYSVAANGSIYRKDIRGIIPEIIINYYDERRTVKDNMLELEKQYELNKTDDLKKEVNRLGNTQMAIKILLNSLYGALGNKYFRYYDLMMAEAVTTTGQLSILTAEKAINNAMNKILNTRDIDYVIAIDTDSVYVHMNELVKAVNPANPVEFLDKACKQKFEKYLEHAYENLHAKMNSYENRMKMKREAISDRGIWIAKKRYILNVHNNEGVQYAEPKLKIMGIEAIKSSTPQIVRDKFKQAFKIIMNNEEKDLIDFVENFRTEFESLRPEDVSFPRGVSDVEKWVDKYTIYKKKTPIHVRGAILHNHVIKTRKLDKKLEYIVNGNKVKFCYLIMPNPIGENVISYINFLPKEFALDKYVDYETQFNKTFKEPLKMVTNAIGWNVEHVATLERFFD